MKIIDLLNKIANGEEIPNKIKYNGEIYERNLYNNKYYRENNKDRDLLDTYLANEEVYNSEIEIIEEDKKIEKFNIDKEPLKGGELVRAIDYIIEAKINEIIDHINKQELPRYSMDDQVDY